MKKPKNYPVKELLVDLRNLKEHLKQLLDKGKPYEEVLRKLLGHKCMEADSEVPLPKFKELAADFGMTTAKAKKALNELYEDIFESNFEYEMLLSFHEVEYIFILENFDKCMTFIVNQLPLLPRVGEHFNIPFFNAEIGARNFFVLEVNHAFEGRKQVITIWLSRGFYNQYFEFKKDEALIKDRISYDEYLEPRGAELKKRIIKY